MPQIFRRSSNTLARTTLIGGAGALFGLVWATYAAYWAPWTTRVGVAIEQPVPFSHKHHVQDDGIDCRYCHTSVEKSGFAGIPPTETCMTCHSQLWREASLLEPVRHSLATGTRLRWNRVHDLPDFVFFNHSIHVAKGVGCSTCHGRVDEMPLVFKQESLYMKWCLDCHSDPARFIRPKAQVFNMDWQPKNQDIVGKQLVNAYHVHTTQLTDCSMCHR
ncbi:MAG TPA: cytochrome c3 family protein [Candidatus Saccharimonadales bacterium]|nr:cytochrome c3 family protein [Candidatus Saccharimonadales bacterium]